MITISDKQNDILLSTTTKPLTYIAITSTNKITFDYLLIKNYYVSSISIRVYYDSKWVVVLDNYTLMGNPDSEEDSEKYFLISSKELKFESDDSDAFSKDFTELRIYLHQPSEYWKEFNLPYIKLLNQNDLSMNDNLKFEGASTNKHKFIFKDRGITLHINNEELNHHYIVYPKHSESYEIDYFY
jgi:hypothetical protein